MEDRRWIYSVLGLLLSLLMAAGQSPDCIGYFIYSQCHVYRFDGKGWTDAERTCGDYTIDGFSGTLAGHLTVITSADKQQEIAVLFKRIAINTAWVGATNRPLYWTWKASSRILQTQGCYRDDGKDLSLVVNSTGLSTEACIDSCARNGFGFAGMQGGLRCLCGNTMTADNLAVGGGCVVPCGVPSRLSDTCGGAGSLNSVYKIGGSNARWGYNQPSNDVTGPRSCGVLDTQLDSNLNDEDCTSSFDFLCQLTSAAGCGSTSNTRLLSTTCYYISSGAQTPLPWSDASAACQAQGGELASVDNRNLQLALAGWLTELFPGQAKKIWVGAYKGGWYWMAGYSFEYTNWAPGHPIQSDKPLCLRINAGLNYQWESLPCDDRNFFICQRGYEPTTTPSNIWISSTLAPSTGSGGYINATNTNATGPFFVESQSNPGGLSNLAIGLLALLASLLFLMGLIGLILCLLCCCAKRRATKKVDCERWHDARPIAHVPNGGEEFSSTVTHTEKTLKTT